MAIDWWTGGEVEKVRREDEIGGLVRGIVVVRRGELRRRREGMGDVMVLRFAFVVDSCWDLDVWSGILVISSSLSKYDETSF